MTETVKFVDGVSYTEADQSEWNMRVERPQGVFADSSLGVIIASAPGGMVVRVSPGHAMVRGFLYANDANKDITISANSSGSARVDTIVLRLVPTSNICTAVVVTGTPGAGAPALTQVVGGTWEFPLCDVAVANGAASILAGNLTDRRVFSVWPASALDSALATDADVTAEAAARSSADSTETTNRTNADNTEATTRANADTALSNRITTLEGYGKIRAYVNFAGGTATIGFQLNVASITRFSAGNYGINFASALPSANYTVHIQSVGSHRICTVTGKTTTQVTLLTVDPSTFGNVDTNTVDVTVVL